MLIINYCFRARRIINRKELDFEETISIDIELCINEYKPRGSEEILINIDGKSKNADPEVVKNLIENNAKENDENTKHKLSSMLTFLHLITMYKCRDIINRNGNFI